MRFWPQHYQERWAEFLSGTWTQELPVRPGRYLIAHDTGDVGTGLIDIPAFDRFEHYHQSVGGWFWSVDLPQLPLPKQVRNKVRRKAESGGQ